MGQMIEAESSVKVFQHLQKHVQRNVVTQTRTALKLLRPVLASHLLKLCEYKAYVHTRLTYAAPAWFTLTSETGRKSLRAHQWLALRTISGTPSFIRNQVFSRDLRMESLDDFICFKIESIKIQQDDPIHEGVSIVTRPTEN
ncbi:unnamed protein product [Leptidea sinapis]|uniref:Uncharacterized protein n=1 Tax=Leptidea sinapis TaxID=189913 RepID=A0A5E4QUL3_9NEOP|nr:unnamed protein product [Leptidea sinapis]